MDNYNEVVGFNKERELENLHNGKNIEDICYDIMEYANEFEVLDAAMTLLDGVIDWMALNIENENERKDAEKLKTAFNLMDEVKKFIREEVQILENRGIRDWATIKSTLKDHIRDYIFQRTKRNPMILPIIMSL